MQSDMPAWSSLLSAACSSRSGTFGAALKRVVMEKRNKRLRRAIEEYDGFGG
jgi:hypothetical protein